VSAALLAAGVVCVWLCARLKECQYAAPGSTPYRESLVAPYDAPDMYPYEAIASRVTKPLTNNDVLWLISHLDDRGPEVVVVLGESKSDAAAAVLLLRAHSNSSANASTFVYYQAVGRIDHSRVMDLLARDYQDYGYRMPWAFAVASRMGRRIDLFGGDSHRHVDHVYEWWQSEGREAFFARYPEHRELRYPDGPDVFRLAPTPGP